MSPTPSFSEYQGPYNISAEDARELAEYDGPVVRTTDELPVLTWEEVLEVSNDVTAALIRAAPIPGLSPELTRKNYQGTMLENLYDRTAIMEQTDPDIFQPAVLRALQELVLTKWPLWRVAFLGDEPDEAILVYPKCFRIGRKQRKHFRELLDSP